MELKEMQKTIKNGETVYTTVGKDVRDMQVTCVKPEGIQCGNTFLPYGTYKTRWFMTKEALYDQKMSKFINASGRRYNDAGRIERWKEYTDESIKLLLNAVMASACEDYMTCLECKHQSDVVVHTMREIEGFLKHSPMVGHMKLDGERLIQGLQDKVWGNAECGS